MKTIREIAEEIGVSKQAVYKRYKGKLYQTVLPYARVSNGTIYILEQGENIIKQDFLRDSVSDGAHMEYAQGALIFMLQKELEMKNKQIEELTNVIKIQAESAEKFQKAKHQKKKKITTRIIKSAPIERLMHN